ncbi:MAG TPA: hypothetical protein VG406_11870 [Isosphaeraceae bacterium]|jgi:hypothetical protein|nr:hypothetical protein [Isosphaeraceae bacterium]
MKRTFAAVALLAALGVLLKLAAKDAARPAVAPVASGPASTGPEPDPDAAILARYPDDRPLVARALDRYRQTARAIERTDGLRGLVLLDRLDIEAVFLYENYPGEFRRLRDSLTDDAAADLLLHWREYFGLKRADATDRAILIAEVARLTPSQRRLAAKYPNALPLILTDPEGVSDLLRRLSREPKTLRDALVILDFISLERGAADLRRALETLDQHGTLAVEAFRLQGLDGFALVTLYGPVLEALGDALPLDQALILLRVNAEDVDEMLRTRSADAVAGDLRHVAARGLVEQVGGSPHALRLVVEYGDRGEKALVQAGPDAADVVFEEYADATLRSQAVSCLAEHGTMALAMLAKYAPDPDFREVLRRHGAPIIPPIARADVGPDALQALRGKSKRTFLESLSLGVLYLSGDNGQATIRLIKDDGLERVAELDATDVQFYQFLPLYDLLHLANVLGRGQSPTTGEMTWALVDGCFVVADALSLAAVQPEGVAASEAARSQVKSAARQAARALGREATEEAAAVGSRSLARRGGAAGAEGLTEQLSKWWAVRLAGGTYRVLRRLPEALDRLSLTKLADLGRPLCSRAGLRLSTWQPLRFVAKTIPQIPPSRGLKYVAAQVVQAGVGVIAFHKMEEHLASRRPPVADGPARSAATP